MSKLSLEQIDACIYSIQKWNPQNGIPSGMSVFKRGSRAYELDILLNYSLLELEKKKL